MVKWRGRRQSKNVEDRRGAGAAMGASGLLIFLLRIIVGRFGIRGVFFLLLVGGGLYMAGVDPMALMNGQPASQAQVEPIDDETSEFVRVVLAETEDVWSTIFANAGASYEAPALVMFSKSINSACGYASAAAGPFYCPFDRKVYLDASFFNELSTRFGAPGDFAAVYVIAHEIGHHVQTITGISEQVRDAQGRANKSQSNALQVRMELQADCYSGVWAKHVDRMDDFLDDDDIEEGLRAAAAIGDDTLQRNAGRRVTPESFTHGSSEQRVRWFTKGYRSGSVDSCDTFNAARL